MFKGGEVISNRTGAAPKASLKGWIEESGLTPCVPIGQAAASPCGRGPSAYADARPTFKRQDWGASISRSLIDTANVHAGKGRSVS